MERERRGKEEPPKKGKQKIQEKREKRENKRDSWWRKTIVKERRGSGEKQTENKK